MSEYKLKAITHKERKEYIKALLEISQDKVTKKDPMQGMEKLTAYREKFLKDHLMEEVDLDSMPAEEFDKLLEKIEEKMDFLMGLKRLIGSASLNIAPLKEPQ